MLELGTELCACWGTLNHFLAGGGQMSLGSIAYLIVFFVDVGFGVVCFGFLGFFFSFFLEVTEEQYNKKLSGNLTLAF